jgi:Putative beta-barrel porin 2
MKINYIAVLVLAVVLPSVAVAQGQDRPLGFNARQQFTFDSNALQLREGARPPAAFGTERNDRISTTSVGAAYQDSFGTHSVTARGDLANTKRSNFGLLDSTTYGLSATQSGDWNPAVYSTLNVNLSKVNTSLANQLAVEPNLTTSLVFGGTLGYRFDPTWSVFLGLDQTKRDNSSALLAQSDTRLSGKELGVRYQPLSGIDGSLLWRRVDVRFPNAQTVDLLGNALPSAVSNTYQQNQYLFRTTYQPSGISTLSGEIGYSSTSYAALSQRNSGGLILRATYNYAVSDAWEIVSKLSRDNSVAASAFASSVLTTSAGFAAIWKATGRTSVRANIDWITRDFSQDAGVAQGITANRKDTSRNFGVGANYELLRSLNLTANYLKYSRGSSIATYSMGGHSLGVGLDFNIR